MPEADTFDAPDGGTFHGELLEAVTEAFVGNGVLADGEALVTADAGTDMGIDVSAAATGITYGGTDYTPTASSFTLSDGPTTTTGGQDDRRVDLVYFDSGTGSFAVSEGTPEPNPSPPATPADSLMLALVEVPHEATNVGDGAILNWRARPNGFPGSIETDAIVDDAVTTAKIASGAVTSTEIADGTIDTVDIANDAITAALIASGAVGTTQLATDAVTQNELASGSVGSPEIIDGSVDTVDIANDAITAALIASGAVDTAAIASGAVTSTEIADGTITDTDISSSTTIARGKLDDERVTSAGVTTNTTTSGEEVLLVDTSGGAVTVTLATADANEGNFVTVIDVGGSASTNAITIATEGTETIDGASTYSLETDYGAYIVASDGTNWFSAGGGSGGGVAVEDDGVAVVDPASAINFRSRAGVTDDGDGTVTVDVGGDPIEEARVSESGTVADTNDDVLFMTNVPNNATFEVRQAAFTQADGQAAPTGFNLKIATFDNAGASTDQTTVVSGDGSTVHDDETYGVGTNTYANTTGSAQTVGLLAENGSGASVDYVAMAIGEVHTDTSTLVSSQLEQIWANETGSVPTGEAGTVFITNVPDGSTLNVNQASFLLRDGQAIPSGVDLIFATFDGAGGATKQSDILTGDGSTVYDDQTGSPLTSYSNSSGGAQTVAVLVDNGNFGTGSGAAEDVAVSAIGEVIA